MFKLGVLIEPVCVLQEFKFQGVKMKGPLRALKKTGSSGRWISNIQRDVFRKINKDDQDQVSHWQQSSKFMHEQSFTYFIQGFRLSKVPICFLDVPVHKLTEQGIQAIQLPICLPHELLPWLERRNVFPKLDQKDLKKWWDHAAEHDLPHQVFSADCHPLWIWGDDCQFNELGEKLICISMGHILDPRTFSMESCYPIFVLREEACFNVLFFIIAHFLAFKPLPSNLECLRK